MIENLLTLAMLTMLQAVLGFDNLLYISLESKRAPAAERTRVRKLGIGIAIVLRLVLLFVLVNLVEKFTHPMHDGIDWGIVKAQFSIHSLIVLAGGTFILYTAVKEILHMTRIEEDEAKQDKAPKSAGAAIAMIVAMNVVFSFDSILSAIALTRTFWVMAAAVIIGGILMIWLADQVSSFLQRNRMYEVLGLFILFVVGIMLLSEGGHLAHLELFGEHITSMSKATFYFVIAVLVLVDVVQGRYQKKLFAASEASASEA